MLILYMLILSRYFSMFLLTCVKRTTNCGINNNKILIFIIFHFIPAILIHTIYLTLEKTVLLFSYNDYLLATNRLNGLDILC